MGEIKRLKTHLEEEKKEAPTQKIQLSDVCSFSVESNPDNTNKKITFFYKPKPGEEHKSIMLSTYPPDPPSPREYPMRYDKEKMQWTVELERSKDSGEKFYIVSDVGPSDAKEKKYAAPILQEGHLALKNGIQQPVNKIPGAPEGKLETLLLKKNGEIQKVDKADESKLEPGERFITVHTPPGYDPEKKPPYSLQIVLDGRQYLEVMNMNVVLDNLVAANQIEPVVTVFISPHSGPPVKEAEGFSCVMPKGWPLSMRLKEYCCNPGFADKLATIPDTLRKQAFNVVTRDPEHTTIWGMSAGGLQAEYTALLHSGIFGNVVAQSPMAWNVPVQNGKNWRAGIIDKKDDKGIDITWSTSTAELPEEEGPHKEYLTEILRRGYDDISRRLINPHQKTLRFYFDAGEKEKEYNAEEGSANLVKATELFAEALEEKRHIVIDHGVHILPGGHHTMTWMGNLADASRAIHSPVEPSATLTSSPSEKKEKLTLTSTARTATVLSISSTSIPADIVEEEKKNTLESPPPTPSVRAKIIDDSDADITDEEMAKSIFGKGTDTAKKLLPKLPKR